MNDIITLRQKIMSGVISVKEITLDILSKIHADDHNCFITVFDDAVYAAEETDRSIKKGFKGRLLGIPIAIKDNMRYKGSVTTCGSAILHSVDEVDAKAVELLKNEGAIIIGKTNMDEFAMGSSNMTSHFGRVLNPIDPHRVPGGSSGGSAAAVALGLCFGALGSDTGGSIRQPASYCGVVGLKPTLGSIKSDGMYALSQDMDQIGPITKTVADSRLLFEILSETKTESRDIKGLRIGVIKEQLDRYTSDTAKVIEQAKKTLEMRGCKFKEIAVPSSQAAYAVYCVLGNAQAANNLLHIGNNAELKYLGKEVKKRIIIGEYVSAHPEIINKASKVRQAIVSELDNAFEQCDCLISPTAPSTAFKFSDDPKNDEIVYSDIFTQPPSIAGLPAISVPCVNGKDGMPIGLQLVGRRNSESLLFSLGELFA